MEFLTHLIDGQEPGASGRKGVFQRACSPVPPPAALFGALLLAALIFFHAFGNGRNGLAATGALGADAGAGMGPFASLTLEAQSAYVYDLATETVLFERYPERRMALASLAKLMTALAARRLLDPDAQVRISAHAVGAQGDDGLFVNERFRAEDVLDIMLVRSSIDAALALTEAGASILGELPAGAAATATTTPQPHTSAGGEEADLDAVMPFIRFMNAEAQRLGLRETEFFNSTGLDVSEDLSGAYGSAKDIIALAAAFLREAPEQFGATRRTALSIGSIDGFVHKLKNTNDLLHDIPGLIAAKTGFTDLAGGNLLVLFDLGVQHPIAAVVLGSTERGRFTDMLQLINATYAGRPQPPL